jgi:uridine kinase
MDKQLPQLALNRVQDILREDSRQDFPVVQSVSLFFQQRLALWTRQIADASSPFVIALTGPSGSGKSFLRKILVEQLSRCSSTSAFTQDNYYRDFELDFPHLPLDRFYDEIDFDDPAHIRFRRLANDLSHLRSLPLGSRLGIPKLRYGTPTRKPTIIEEGLEIEVTPFIVTEGIHAFQHPAVLPHYDLKIYVDVDEQTRRERWLARNRLENRGVTDNMWQTTVACLENHILPARQVADLVINNNAPREQVAGFVTELIRSLARLRVPKAKQEASAASQQEIA